MKPIYGKKYWRDKIAEMRLRSWTEEFKEMMKHLWAWMESK